MADYILGENQLKLVVELLKEQDVSEKIDYCKDTFGTRTPEYRFCTKAAGYIKSQKSYQSDFRKYLETYVDNIVMDRIMIERLTKDHPILTKGIKEIEDFKNLMGGFCNNLDTDELVRRLIDDEHVYYKRPDGEYSVFNRIDTNYSALAVALTFYYNSKGAFELLMHDMGNKLSKVDWNSLAVSWIDHFFNEELEPYDPRPENFRASGPIFDTDSSPSYVLFNKMFDPKNIKVDSKKIFDSILKVLKDVRERGFATEDLFQEKLDEYRIPYKRYARDYGFVDRFLGVDFVVQKGNEWLPVQVKSSKNEPQYRIEELDCDEPIIAIKDGNDFRLNNSRGFERYFCDFLKVCRKV
jgi:hypothetical protein